MASGLPFDASGLDPGADHKGNLILPKAEISWGVEHQWADTVFHGRARLGVCFTDRCSFDVFSFLQDAMTREQWAPTLLRPPAAPVRQRSPRRFFLLRDGTSCPPMEMGLNVCK